MESEVRTNMEIEFTAERVVSPEVQRGLKAIHPNLYARWNGRHRYWEIWRMNYVESDEPLFPLAVGQEIDGRTYDRLCYGVWLAKKAVAEIDSMLVDEASGMSGEREEAAYKTRWATRRWF